MPAAVTAAAAALFTVTSCGTSHPAAAPAAAPTVSPSHFTPEPLPPGRPGKLPVTLPRPATVDDLSATAVSRAVIIIQWTMDTVIDTSQYQAELRSGPFLTPAYLAALRASPPVSAPGAQWNAWAAHHAYTTVVPRAEFDDPPPDTATLARRQWGITVTPHGIIPGCRPRPRLSPYHHAASPPGRARPAPSRTHHSASRPRPQPCGWTAPPLTATVFVTLTRPAASSPWRVSAVLVTF
jgi:hypothetical protein